MSKSAGKKVLVFDTTLRDGEQCPGASMNIAEKLQVARQLERLGVDVIEAGFPVSSEGDFEAVSKISAELKKCSVSGLARAVEKDIKCCWDSLKGAVKPRIHTFIATSPIHRKAKLKMSRSQVIENAVKAVRLSKSLCDDVEFSAEDATRTEPDFLIKAVKAAADAGASTVNIPDTVGYTMPGEFSDIIKKVREALPDSVRVSVHCHNDLGMATANSLAAVLAGAGQVECTVNGIGERAGNAALEEIVMSLYVRGDIYGARTGIKRKLLSPTSLLVSRLSGLSVQRNKAVVGANAFRHEAGIHQHGVLQDKLTYEIMTPESVGCKVESLYLGKHSGRHAVSERLKGMGIDVSELDMKDLMSRFKNLADKKKQVYEDELLSLVEDQIGSAAKTYELEYLHALSGSGTVPSATVRLRVSLPGEELRSAQEASTGDGPVDACYNAINRITKMECLLTDYRITAVSRGGDSLGEVTVVLREEGGSAEAQGRGASTDIIEASALAYIAALNRIRAGENRGRGSAAGKKRG